MRVGGEEKEERQEMPAARPSCALTKTRFVVPSTSVGPVGHSQEENYTCVGSAMSRKHIKRSVPIRLYLCDTGERVGAD